MAGELVDRQRLIEVQVRASIKGSFVKLQNIIAAFLVTSALASASVGAVPVIVTDTVSGSAGAYTHTFSLTNNIGGSNALYFFGVDLSGTITGTPASWAGSGNQNGGWTNTYYGGSSSVYPTTWCCTFGATPSGVTSTGFSVLSAFSPATIKFFGYAFGGSDSAADGHFGNAGNPGFEGLVGGTTAAVPEPAAWLLMIGGFGLVGGAMRRRANNVTFA